MNFKLTWFRSSWKLLRYGGRYKIKACLLLEGLWQFMRTYIIFCIFCVEVLNCLNLNNKHIFDANLFFASQLNTWDVMIKNSVIALICHFSNPRLFKIACSHASAPDLFIITHFNQSPWQLNPWICLNDIGINENVRELSQITPGPKILTHYILHFVSRNTLKGNLGIDFRLNFSLTSLFLSDVSVEYVKWDQLLLKATCALSQIDICKYKDSPDYCSTDNI